ncbi:gamma-glutamyl phosphate reductase [Tetragenococcus halophilus]|uniref:Gamma-glutamyl phosphate reductase n=1 Tax=Tetragenococcus halophilus TaxID=51669 RepID=A0AB37D4N5_TETHA|nr:glutamate-5-semialdehyde dehydrogenase [Tetragenococcus halophilus]MCF1674907.1 glutamate-5-semialdehyde dehydrogenase [Tetragenococcus halophilus]MDN6839155.1 glutamate-5-semialdehyde dehydrogenase [Tetragenococcus halophilus]QGP76550.1 glutamate-5-semialdehyde dehydrogenase [Tetragenococcus halophilus]GEQ38065.1 gamma-glutamyl phosphate reductase [Tetragenococcus halophilus]GEQ40299.1 gamma-glutamyl phosphate reductase [Tetragenococcus halophilus]
MTDLQTLGQQAKEAATELALLNTKEKNQLLENMACAIENNTEEILQANQKDLEQADENGIKEVMKDRLRLSEERIEAMAAGIRQIIQLNDPIGTIKHMWKNEEGLTIGQKQVPIGVIGIIYESRPNVTTDAASLCFKSGNAVILRGGKESFYSNQLLVSILQEALEENQFSSHAIQFIDDTTHETANEMMQLTDFLDVLIPRGGEGLIKHVKENAKVPVIETGTGNNHIYIDKDAQVNMATDIVANAKAQRPSVCNACETLLIHKEVAAFFLPAIEERLIELGIELRADEIASDYLPSATLATEEDWSTEFLDYILAIKVVDSAEEAISHINRYNTKHSEAIVTDNYFTAQKFLNEVDAAAVYVNASTRFTDGFVFGFGAEIGISTQKLHARGPMGLEALTSIKYIIYGDGQTRA